MAPFAAFVSLLSDIEDPRRAEGKRYRLPHVLLFAILAIVSGANSYRTVHSFIEVHLARLRGTFGLKWRKAPAYTTIRGIIRQLDPASVEAVFRRHAAALSERTTGQRLVAIDGKTLRHSFDNFADRRAAHILTAFAVDSALVLAHLECDAGTGALRIACTTSAILASLKMRAGSAATLASLLACGRLPPTSCEPTTLRMSPMPGTASRLAGSTQFSRCIL